MLPELVFIAVAGVYNPMDMSGHRMYPSGVKEIDKYSPYALPASKLAQLTLTQPIVSDDGRVIKTGYYLAGLSVSRLNILLFEGEKEVFSAKISETVVLDKPFKLPVAEFYSYNNGETFIILTQGKYRVKAPVNLPIRNTNYNY